MDGKTLSKQGVLPQGRFILTAYGWAVAFVLLISGVLFAPVMRGLPVWDDAGFVSGETVGGGDSLIGCFTEPFNHAYYRPLVSLSVYLDRQLLGNNTFVYHQSNVLYHLLTVAALIALVTTAFGNRRLGLLAGLLFGVQPVQVSTVAWIGGRTDSLCALFVTVFALGIVKWHKTNRHGWLGLGLLAFFCAAMTKEQAVALFPAVPLSAFCFGPNENRMRRAVWSGLAAFAVSVLFVSLWFLNYPNPMEANAAPLSERLELFLSSVAHYGILLVAPNPTRMHMFSLANHDQNPVQWLVLGGLFAVALASLGVLLWKRSRPAFWFLALAFLGFLPVSNIIPMPSLTVAPYRVGIAGIGTAVALAFGLKSMAERLRWPATALGTAYAAACGAMVLWGSGSWVSNESLFGSISHYDPYCLVARMNLGQELVKQERWTEVDFHTTQVLDYLFRSNEWRQLDKAPALVESDPRILDRVAHNQGNRVEAESLVGRYLYLYGGAREEAGEKRAAMAAYRAAEEIYPEFADPIVAIGWMVEKTDPKEAERRFRMALLLDPAQSGAARYLAKKCEREGDLEGALGYYRTAAKGAPWSGEFQLLAAQVLYRLKRYDEALAELRGAEKKWTNRKTLQALRDKIRGARDI